MAKTPAKAAQREFSHTWFLQEWMGTLGLRQADLQKEFGWSKGKAHDVWHGQRYNQALIDQLAPWLKVRPYELLMPPELAMAFRQLREQAARIVNTPEPPQTPPPAIRRVS